MDKRAIVGSRDPAQATRTMKHMVITRTLFRRLVAHEKDWQTLFDPHDLFPTREAALKAIDKMPEPMVYMPACDDHDETGECRGHAK